MNSPDTRSKPGTGLARRFLATLSAATVGAALTLSGPAHAATIAELSVDEMLKRSALVVEGRVTAVENDAARPGPRSRHPWTGVTLTVTDTIKGSAGASSLTLYFVGGERNGRVTVVPGMTIPSLGDVGVFFVAAPSEKRMNPLIGWAQGHFRIDNLHGGPRVTTEGGAPVFGLTGGEMSVARPFSKGTANGVTMVPNGGRAMSPTEFKRRLRDLLATGGAR